MRIKNIIIDRILVQSEHEMLSRWGQYDKPLVSINCLAYNHGKFIRAALDGFLIQKTDFPFEILIHDDASTDDTADIIREYVKKYPNIIKPIYQTENQHSQGNKPGKLNVKRAQGEYLAWCEGDDYWIDPQKLEKQVSFLEGNKDYGLVHGNCHVYYQKNKRWFFEANNKYNNVSEYNKKDLFYHIIHSKYIIRTASVLLRRHLLDKIPSNSLQFPMGDTPLWLDLSQITKFKYIDNVFTVYRILPESASKSRDNKKLYFFRLSGAEMRIYYCIKYNYSLSKELKNKYNELLLTYKLFDSAYNEKYPLFSPNKYQKFKFKRLRSVFFARIFFFEWFILKKCKYGIKKFVYEKMMCFK